MIVLTYHFFPYARTELSASAALKRGATTTRTAAALMLGLGFVLVLGGFSAWLLLACCIGVALSCGGIAKRRFGGITGDVCGAICALAELVTIVLSPGLLAR